MQDRGILPIPWRSRVTYSDGKTKSRYCFVWGEKKKAANLPFIPGGRWTIRVVCQVH